MGVFIKQYFHFIRRSDDSVSHCGSLGPLKLDIIKI